MNLVIYEEDYHRINAVCVALLRSSGAQAVVLVDKNGQVITAAGDTVNLDITSLASLIAGSIAATGGLAKLVGEREFTTLSQEGENENFFISVFANNVILAAIYDNRTSLGLVKLRTKKACDDLALLFQALRQRAPQGGGAQPSPFSEITDDDIENLFSD